jgi:quercetin dioxygenase-like cupin family protein
VTGRAALAAAAAALTLAGCGDDGEATERPGIRGALGGEARVETLARTRLPASPTGPVSWVADELRLSPGRELEHSHEPAFVQGRAATSALAVDGQRTRIEEGEGAFVPGGRPHRHRAAGGPATLWEIRLAPPGAAPLTGSRRVFESEPLEGIPSRPLASFLEVTVPARGGETTVHTHPGPEFIYQLEGRIEYQNELIGSRRLGPGGAEAIPPDTAVQKRNPFPADARFLSWFLVDPRKPFAPLAEFRSERR